MKDIEDYIHKFEIEGQQIELSINCKDSLWTSDIIKGETGLGRSTGGVFHSLEEYIKEEEGEHRYAYYFFANSNNAYEVWKNRNKITS